MMIINAVDENVCNLSDMFEGCFISAFCFSFTVPAKSNEKINTQAMLSKLISKCQVNDCQNSQYKILVIMSL